MPEKSFVSKALQVNLEKTWVGEIVFDPKYNILLEALSPYPGLKEKCEKLLKECFHPYKNLSFLIENLRNFFLENLSVFYFLPSSIKDLVFVRIFDLITDFFEKDSFELNIKVSSTLLAFLEKLAELGKKNPEEFPSEFVLEEVLKFLYYLPDELFLTLLESPFSFKRFCKTLKSLGISKNLEDKLSSFLKKVYVFTYTLWIKLTGEEVKRLLEDFSEYYDTYKLHPSYFESLIELLKTKSFTLEELFSFPEHLELLKELKNFIYTIEKIKEIDPELKFFLLFKFVENPVLRLIHEELLKEINYILIDSIRKESVENLDKLIIKFFHILKKKVKLYPWTALESIKHIGISILKKEDPYLAEIFISELIQFGFEPPEISGIDVDWKIKGNPYHVFNIKVWLEIFKIHPEWCISLLSALILNLHLYGVGIKDTDLFQKEVTSLLNSKIASVYTIVKEFCRILPVYYNEIGAEGLIRDISTELDELERREDTLIHFLRKFVHIENSPLAVEFIQKIFEFWLTLNENVVKSYLPEILHERVFVKERHFHENMHKFLSKLVKTRKELFEFVDKPLEEIERVLSSLHKISGNSFKNKEKTIKKLFLLIRLYKLEKEKYFFEISDFKEFFNYYKNLGFEKLEELEEFLLKEKDSYKKAEKIVDYLNFLKENIILSEKRFTASEEILYKRHIAVDIPSMYGRYKEKKFDALSITFRLEKLLSKYISEFVGKFNPEIPVRSDLFKALKILKFFEKALSIEGIYSEKFEQYVELLERGLKNFSLDYGQYFDIFKGLVESVREIINTYYVKPYLRVFKLVFEALKPEFLKEEYKKIFQEGDRKKAYYIISEQVIKKILGTSPIIEELDRFVNTLYRSFSSLKDKVKEEDLPIFLTYDKRRVFSSLREPNPFVFDIFYLGNKGYNLTLLFQEKKLNIKIPEGFILTTEVFRCYPVIKKYPELFEDFKNMVLEEISRLEEFTSKKFGFPKNPLLLSIRSGAPISMPGMMNTILNVGINEEIVESLYRWSGNLWFAWDTYRRFIQSYAMACGIKREFFNALMREHKRKYGVKKKAEFTGKQMKELALIYKKRVEDIGVKIPEEPEEQLFSSIELILNSWHNEKAKNYRKVMGLSEEWGTAVVVQEMVFGNISPLSGTGVTLTTSPFGKIPRITLWGDYSCGNQGEDVVSGLVSTYPISIEQQKFEKREGPSLEEKFPEVYQVLKELAYYLVYEKRWGHQEIEFTFESRNNKIFNCYILQVRSLILREEKEEDFVLWDSLKKLKKIGRGIGVTGGIVSGRVVFDKEDVKIFKEKGEKVILLRYDTVPDDISEITLVDGILTSRGGQTSHAAIVASRLGKVCVVGCEELKVDELSKIAKLADESLFPGSWITLNGTSGEIYSGKIEEGLKK